MLVSQRRPCAAAAQSSPSAYASPTLAFSTLVVDANFECMSLQLDKWTAQRAPTFAYEFNDDSAPPRYGLLRHTPGPTGSTAHGRSCKTLPVGPVAPCAAPTGSTAR